MISAVNTLAVDYTNVKDVLQILPNEPLLTSRGVQWDGIYLEYYRHQLVEAAQPSNVDTVVVDGRIWKRNGQLTALDNKQIIKVFLVFQKLE